MSEQEFDEKLFRERTAAGKQPRLWEVRALLDELDWCRRYGRNSSVATSAANVVAGQDGAAVTRLIAENNMLRQVIAMTDPCIHQAALDAQQAHADGRTITIEQYMADRGLQ